MRNSILAVAIAFVLAAPCTALAGDKKDKPTIASETNRGLASQEVARRGLDSTTGTQPSQVMKLKSRQQQQAKPTSRSR
jgi:hypothetical protein